MQIRIALADDHPIVLEGLRKMFVGHSQIAVIGCFLSGSELLRFLETETVDVLLLDVYMKGMQGDETAQIVTERFPGIPIIALSNIDQPFTARSMIKAGVKGYLLKGADRDLLAGVIERVHQGEFYIDEALRDVLLTGADPEHSVPHLTSREQMVLELIAQQMTTKDISTKLFISVSRIEACRMDLFLKLGVRNVAGLIRQAIKLGFIQ